MDSIVKYRHIDRHDMGLVPRKPVFGVSDQVIHKPANKQIIKVLIKLPGCAGWSAPLLFTNPRRQVFSRQGLNYINTHLSVGEGHKKAHLMIGPI